MAAAGERRRRPVPPAAAERLEEHGRIGQPAGVSDTGPGVLSEEIPLIFERFHRGSGPRAAGSPGVGLGLAICRALVERQGGRISVASAPGRGATFAIRLPIAPAPARASASVLHDR
jgi:two-component system, OmpR family, sensor kinase